MQRGFWHPGPIWEMENPKPSKGTGKKEAKQKIAMTTPMFISGSGSNATMAFVPPEKLPAGEVPKLQTAR